MGTLIDQQPSAGSKFVPRLTDHEIIAAYEVYTTKPAC